MMVENRDYGCCCQRIARKLAPPCPPSPSEAHLRTLTYPPCLNVLALLNHRNSRARAHTNTNTNAHTHTHTRTRTHAHTHTCAPTRTPCPQVSCQCARRANCCLAAAGPRPRRGPRQPGCRRLPSRCPAAYRRLCTASLTCARLWVPKPRPRVRAGWVVCTRHDIVSRPPPRGGATLPASHQGTFVFVFGVAFTVFSGFRN